MSSNETTTHPQIYYETIPDTLPSALPVYCLCGLTLTNVEGRLPRSMVSSIIRLYACLKRALFVLPTGLGHTYMVVRGKSVKIVDFLLKPVD
jgi:hypothetical protein